ncbi:hypothetical protein BDW75DRAFT_217941 [Aspergillus navahoensis]
MKTPKQKDRRQQEAQDDGFKSGCSCPLPWEGRTAAAFLHQYMYYDCYQFCRQIRARF